MLLESEPAAERAELLGSLRESGEHLLSLLNDVIDFAHLSEQEFSLVPKPFIPTALARKVETLFLSRAQMKGLSLMVLIGGDAEYERLGDERRILQILHNLVSNAIKFTDTGDITITVIGRGLRGLTISVSDTGIGIPQEAQERIFAEFEQVDTTDERAHEGTGLGLSIVRNLVARMGGKIALESALGEGTRFVVDLPLAFVGPANGDNKTNT